MEDPTQLSEAIGELLDAEPGPRLADLVRDAHPADLARALRDLPVPDQIRLLRRLDRDQAGAVLHELDDSTRAALVQGLDETELSGILDQMPTDNAVAVIQDLPDEQAEKVIDLLPEAKAEEVQELLEYADQTAGRIMSRRVVAIHEEATVAQAIDHIRETASAEQQFYLYVLDDHDHLVGVVPFRRLLTAPPVTPVKLIATSEVVRVTADTDQEEVAQLVTKYRLVAIPVVDRAGRLLGTITVDDVLDIVQAEATEDIQRLGGVAGDETVFDPPRAVFPRRVVWLLINLGTAILAASVIGVFEGSIQTLAALAVFMPIVASMGGIGTTQTSTLVIRGLALGELTAPHVRRVLRKELWLSLTTGATNAAVMMAIAYLWKRQLLLSLILGVALVLNMLVAAVVGVLVPVALKTFRIDPAIASSVIITTFTDVFGFFSFLGLATLLIRFLL
jgi:magnesium transporter